MIKKLENAQSKRKLINHGNLTGDFSNLTGNAIGIHGDISPYLRGDISPGLHGVISPGLHGVISPYLRGDISSLFGDCSGITGNIDDCGITDDERENGVDISELVAA